LVDFEEGIQDVTGMVLSDSYGFYPPPASPVSSTCWSPARFIGPLIR
jgi:hypothetical protein